MDVNASLAELREWTCKEPTDELEQRAMELFAAMDESLTTGGFLPAAWTRGRLFELSYRVGDVTHVELVRGESPDDVIQRAPKGAVNVTATEPFGRHRKPEQS